LILEAGRFQVNEYQEVKLNNDERIAGVKATPYDFENQAHYKDFQFMICKMVKPVTPV
jgi:hypothetical protein